jgi:CBS domain-containing protein
MKIKEVMTKEVVTLEPDDTILDASLKLSNKKISGAPVVDADGKVIGVFSEADILKRLKVTSKTLRMIYPSLCSVCVTFQEEETERETLEAYKEVAGMKVKELMTTNVETVGPEGEVRDAIKKMVAKSINRLPVVDELGKAIGIITRGDILRGMAMESNNNKK